MSEQLKNNVNFESSNPRSFLGVKIISILLIVLSLSVLSLVVLSSYFLHLPDPRNYGYPSNLYQILNTGLIIFSFVIAIIGILLWRKYNWARIFAIELSLLLTGVFLFSFLINFILLGSIEGSVPLIISSLIFGYLSFSKKVKLVFNPEKKLKIKDISLATGTFVGLIILFGVLFSAL